MNKSYMCLSEKEMFVIDTDGNLVRRDIESDDVNTQLLLENNLEEIDKIISYDLEQIERYESYCDNKFNFICFAIAVIMVIVGIPLMCTNSHLLNFIGLCSCASGSLPTLIFLLAIFIGKDNKKILEGLKKELSEAYEIKEEYEKSLSKCKEIELENNSKINTETNSITLKEPFSLERHTSDFEKKLELLNEKYQEGYMSVGKKRVLSKGDRYFKKPL